MRGWRFMDGAGQCGMNGCTSFRHTAARAGRSVAPPSCEAPPGCQTAAVSSTVRPLGARCRIRRRSTCTPSTWMERTIHRSHRVTRPSWSQTFITPVDWSFRASGATRISGSSRPESRRSITRAGPSPSRGRPVRFRRRRSALTDLNWCTYPTMAATRICGWRERTVRVLARLPSSAIPKSRLVCRSGRPPVI
jgi:hypothetical protein